MELLDLSSYTWNFYALPPAVVGVAVALLGLAVLLRERWSPLSMAFFGMTTAGAVWLLGNAMIYLCKDPSLALQWARIENCGVAFIPSAVLVFALDAAGRLRKCRGIAFTMVVLSAFFCFFILFTPLFVRSVKAFFWGYFPQYGPLSVPFLVFFAALLLASLSIYWREYQQASHGPQKRRVGAFMLAFGISYLGSIDFAATFGLPVYPVGYVPVMAFIGITAYTLWRYRLVKITPAFAAAQILKTVSDSLLVIDHEGVVRVVNQAACDLFERSEEKLVGRPIWRIDGSFFPQERFEAFMRTRVIHNFETVCTSSRGRKTVLDVAVSGIRDEMGEPVAVVCVGRDLTERKLAEEELRRVHDALKRSHEQLKATQMQLIEAAKMESVGRLAAGVAHEVKNPLAVILQGLDYLDGHLPTADVDASMVVKAGKEAVRRADTVLRGLLDFSALKTLELSPGSLNDVIPQALMLVKYSLDAGHVKVVLDLEENLPPMALDRTKMEQVFVNLFMNAVHAMPGSGTLTIRTRSAESVVIVEVDDTGAGIPPEVLHKVFDPFFTTKPAGKGTGLGLTVAKSLVELQGGTIEIDNRTEGGVRAVLAFGETEHQKYDKPKEKSAVD